MSDGGHHATEVASRSPEDAFKMFVITQALKRLSAERNTRRNTTTSGESTGDVIHKETTPTLQDIVVTLRGFAKTPGTTAKPQQVDVTEETRPPTPMEPAVTAPMTCDEANAELGAFVRRCVVKLTGLTMDCLSGSELKILCLLVGLPAAAKSKNVICNALKAWFYESKPPDPRRVPDDLSEPWDRKRPRDVIESEFPSHHPASTSATTVPRRIASTKEERPAAGRLSSRGDSRSGEPAMSRNAAATGLRPPPSRVVDATRATTTALHVTDEPKLFQRSAAPTLDDDITEAIIASSSGGTPGGGGGASASSTATDIDFRLLEKKIFSLVVALGVTTEEVLLDKILRLSGCFDGLTLEQVARTVRSLSARDAVVVDSGVIYPL